jgi:hypothetical protein
MDDVMLVGWSGVCIVLLLLMMMMMMMMMRMMMMMMMMMTMTMTMTMMCRYVPHRVEELARLYGGGEAFAEKLNTFFDGGHYNHGG